MIKTRIFLILAIVLALVAIIGMASGGTVTAVGSGMLSIVFALFYMADIEDTMTVDGYVSYW